MIRTFAQEEVETLAKYATIPVINGLTDFCHPCQVLADLMTIREHKGKLEGLKLCYVGDGNNMANSLIVGGLKVGMSVAIACPDTYRPDPEVLAFAEQYPGKFLCTSDILAAAGTPTYSTPMCGPLWARRASSTSGSWSSRAIRSTTP